MLVIFTDTMTPHHNGLLYTVFDITEVYYIYSRGFL